MRGLSEGNESVSLESARQTAADQVEEFFGNQDRCPGSKMPTFELIVPTTWFRSADTLVSWNRGFAMDAANDNTEP